MNTPTPRPFGEVASHLADQATQGAENAIRSTQRVANDALDQLSQGADSVRTKATPVINRVAGEAEQLARRGIDAVRDGSQQLRDKAQRATDSTIGYIRDEPVKSVLISAALGAGLMAILAMLTRSRA